MIARRRRLLLALGTGAFAAPWAALVQAQSTKVARIGLLGPGTAAANEAWVAALRKQLRDLGYVEGANLAFESRWSEGRNERLPELAAELVRAKVDLIVTLQTPSALAAKQATSTVPIIMAPAADPVATGLIASLARPGGNVTGLSGATSELAAKNVELVRAVLPWAKRVAVLANAEDSFTKAFVDRVQSAGQALGIDVQVHRVRVGESFDAAFAAMAKAQANAVLVQPSLPSRPAIELALRHRLPAVSPAQGFADAGGLLAYVESFTDRYRQVAFYVDKVLKGANPADVPVGQPSKFELVINLKTAKQIGVAIPPGVIARADRVIE